MAKVQNPVIGRAKGSAGGMTFNKTYDKNIMKAKPFEVKNPKTIAQVNQRVFFASVSAQAMALNPDQLRAIFPTMPKGISRRNAFFKQLAENYQDVDGQKTMKLADLLSVGNAPTMDMGITTCSIDNGVITVELDAAVKANTEVKDFSFIAMVVNETKNLVSLPITNAKVSVGEISITAPSDWEDTDTIHAIPLITDSKDVIVGFGTLAVSTRPERKG